MSGERQVTVNVHILDREYQIACPEEGQDALLDSARYLNQRMRAIRNRGKALGVERIAVMTSLNMARELLDLQRSGSGVTIDNDAEQRLKRLEAEVEDALRDDDSLN